MYVLGIDPATKSGWAVVERSGPRERLLDHGVVDDGDARGIAAVAEKWQMAEVVAIEGQYFSKNAQTLIRLAEIRGQWRQELERRGKEVWIVNPQTWHTGILAGLVGRGSKRDQVKKASRLYVRQVLRVDLAEDEADAACIALYAGRAGSFEALIAHHRRAGQSAAGEITKHSGQGKRQAGSFIRSRNRVRLSGPLR